MSRDEAARIADEGLARFFALMDAAGNPGSGRHEIGIHHVAGWILDYDSAIGGSEIQAVVGIDGDIHARREPRSMRTQRLSAAEWVLRDATDPDPTGSAIAFTDHLERMLAFNHAAPEGSDGEPPPPASTL